MKLCECGCGEPTKIAKKTNTRDGYIKGEPARYIKGHNSNPMCVYYRKMSMKRRKEFVLKITKQQGVTSGAIFSRMSNGWTWKEIIKGRRSVAKLTEYVEGLRPYDQGETVDAFPGSGIVDNAKIRFMFLLFDTVKSLTKLDDIECYPLTCEVFKGLHDRYNA